MALAVTGSQGNVTNTITNTDASDGTVTVGEISVFTTPATSNAMFRVTLNAIVNVTAGVPNLGLSLPGGPPAVLNAYDSPGSALESTGKSIASGGAAAKDLAVASSELFVGPSTDVKVPYTLINDTAAQAAFQYNISYHYSASVIT